MADTKPLIMNELECYMHKPGMGNLPGIQQLDKDRFFLPNESYLLCEKFQHEPGSDFGAAVVENRGVTYQKSRFRHLNELLEFCKIDPATVYVRETATLKVITPDGGMMTIPELIEFQNQARAQHREAGLAEAAENYTREALMDLEITGVDSQAAILCLAGDSVSVIGKEFGNDLKVFRFSEVASKIYPALGIPIDLRTMVALNPETRKIIGVALDETTDGAGVDDFARRMRSRLKAPQAEGPKAAP
ncbi:MAG TPA: hypothetical protein VHB73_03550 [Alphaproteobacteria bacterium]|nr:hypothetical protein [Alphaproteobacteria bacterium]